MNTQNFFPPYLNPVPAGQTRFRTPGFPDHLRIERSETAITTRTQNIEDSLQISGTPDFVKVDRFGAFNDVNVQRSGQDIRIDRAGFDDMTVRRDENNLSIDRPGFEFDVNAQFNDNAINIRHSGGTQITTLQRQGNEVLVTENGFPSEAFPVSLFPGGGWPEAPSVMAISEFIGVEARAADTLDRWAKDGIQFDDLVRVNRQGQVYTFDDEFR